MKHAEAPKGTYVRVNTRLVLPSHWWIDEGTLGYVTSDATIGDITLRLLTGDYAKECVKIDPRYLDKAEQRHIEGGMATIPGQVLANLEGSDLTKELILKGLEDRFGSKTLLNEATRIPAFADALLEAIRAKQAESWVKATTIEQVASTQWTNDEMQYWNLRHYTSKFVVTLGDEVYDGIFAIAVVEPPPFRELLSTITLATMSGTPGPPTSPATGSKMIMTYTSGNAASGHTTGIDWKNVGNVGDTFYGLFYKDEPATGLTPAFIKDAVYYAMWTAQEFGEGWASADWLGTASESQTTDGKTPGGKARKGAMTDVIADIFPEAATRDFGEEKDRRETADSRQARMERFQAMSNFEVKKHGPMPVREWIPVAGAEANIKKWFVNARTGRFYKGKMFVPVHERIPPASGKKEKSTSD